ncbi:hypothetical protein AURANDRAFT_67289 [Aureococcus anophagefferens]|uniref:Uncharacterized protein n=1 Tax=Aureococcus anophagefferens TaxID=44056 RepID=F0YKN5_AURAN|nr:hypothetical protein AURANDRAFT_67289 [Aureococcus anophagefferens]EGB04329.1 hypothetical protein AURANDRAFT_67289 [Aureococcus anophagefferens]|eukprot:XP_009041039.1 hypothetical protein AURANDRAFT_67289 [Aureococcus anophagefferens]
MHEAKQVRPYWCPGTHNVADVFTKLILGCNGNGRFKSIAFRLPITTGDTQAVYIWDYWNASSGQLPDNYCKSFEYNLCGDGPVNTDVLKHHGSDNSSPSSRAKLNVAKLLYKQGMAKRATRLVQDHHRRGLSPPVPSCQTMVDVDPSFATPNAPSADWSRLSRVVELLACGAILYMSYMLEGSGTKMLYMDLHYWLTIQGE